MAIEKIKILGAPANPVHLPQNWAKLTKLAVLFSW